MVIRGVVLWHDMHGVRRILGRWLCRWGLELGDVGCYHLGLPFLKRDGRDEKRTIKRSTRATYSLEFSQNVLANTVLVKVIFN